MGRLTPRERQVFELIAGGASQKQVARELGISLKTVGVHVTRIGRKLPPVASSPRGRILMTAHVA